VTSLPVRFSRYRGRHARPEEKGAGRRQREVEALEQPKGQQRLDNKAAGEGIEAE
jgi:hypothetical protein